MMLHYVKPKGVNKVREKTSQKYRINLTTSPSVYRKYNYANFEVPIQIDI